MAACVRIGPLSFLSILASFRAWQWNLTLREPHKCLISMPPLIVPEVPSDFTLFVQQISAQQTFFLFAKKARDRHEIAQARERTVTVPLSSTVCHRSVKRGLNYSGSHLRSA